MSLSGVLYVLSVRFGNNNYNKWHLPTVMGLGLALVMAVFPIVNIGSSLDNVVSHLLLLGTFTVTPLMLIACFLMSIP